MPEESKRELTEEVRRALNKSFAERIVESEKSASRRVPEKKGAGYYAFLKRTDPRRVESFTRELAILLGSGMDLLSGLKLLSGREANADFRKVLTGVASMVEQGSSFWQALSKFPHVFPRIYINSVKAGESSGRLEFSLEEISKYYEFEISAKKKLKTVITYPVAVLVLAVIVVLVLSATVLPVFRDMLADLDAETPFIINLLYALGGFFTGYWFVMVIALAFLLLLPAILRHVPGGGILLDRIKLKLPVFGKIFLRITISRFSRNLSILLASGVRITEALDTCAQAAGNSVVADKLYVMKGGIEKGQSIAQILEEPGIFPPLLVDMLVVGEQSGELETVLNRVADVYGREAEDTITTFASILEPALILAMGVLVAFVFTSLFLPYINILAAMGNVGF